MTRYGILVVTVWLVGFPAAAQTPSDRPPSTLFAPPTSVMDSGASLHLKDGLSIQAVLVTPLDAKRSKKGSVVVAKTAQDIQQDGQVVLKKGSELRGHVTQVQARSSRSADSAVGIVFDRVVPKGVHDLVPVSFSIQALAAAHGQSATWSSNDEEVITASGENVQLGTGTQMILQVTR